MFFLGLAGPMMPYMLFLGVMLAFTFGTSKTTLAKTETETAAKIISISPESSSSNELTAVYHTWFQKDRQDQQKTDELKSPPPAHSFTPYNFITQKIDSNPIDLYSHEYNDGYFGLSPPVLFI